MISLIHAPHAPRAVGHYSHATRWADMVFCSGQIGIDPQTGQLVEGLESQVRQIFSNIQAVLYEGDSDLSHIVKVTVFLRDMNDFAAMNEIYGEHFSSHKPARSTIGVSQLPKGALIEIEVVAACKK